jgi:type I restriction enzyme S subunit
MFELKKYMIGEIAKVQTGPFGSQLHMSDYKLKGTPIITVEHLGENKILHDNLPLVGDNDKLRLIKYTLKEGDIVFSRVGSVDRRVYVTAN